jgi:UDP-N-acetylglucosamine 1-carboxyvinyltransferase
MKDIKTVTIKGGYPLCGEVTLPSNKNEVLPVLCGSILVRGVVTIENVPMSPDVVKILEALGKLGAEIVWNGTSVTINTKDLSGWVVDPCVRDIQSAILFAGPLLARFGKAVIPKAIGCELGYRGPQIHIDFFSQAGVTCIETEDSLTFSEVREKNNGSNGTVAEYDLILHKASVTPTENLLMYLSGRSHEIWNIHGIAEEPHVQGLIRFLNSISHNIVTGNGNYRTVNGTSTYSENISHLPALDHIETGGWIVAAAVTKGTITLKDVFTSVDVSSIMSMVRAYQAFNITCVKQGADLLIDCSEYVFQPSQGVERYDANSWKYYPGPWGQFPVDGLPAFTALTLQNKIPNTSVHIINAMFEVALKFSDCFVDMGVDIKSNGTLEIIVPALPYGLTAKASVEAPNVIEGVRAIVLSALGANTGSEITISNVNPLERRSPEIWTTLKKLGAQFDIVS